MQLNLRIVGRPQDVNRLEDILRGLQDLYEQGDLTWTGDFQAVRLLSVSKDYARRNEPGNVARYVTLEVKAS